MVAAGLAVWALPLAAGAATQAPPDAEQELNCVNSEAFEQFRERMRPHIDPIVRYDPEPLPDDHNAHPLWAKAAEKFVTMREAGLPEAVQDAGFEEAVEVLSREEDRKSVV